MIFLVKYSRVLTLFLAILYSLSGSGLDKVTYRCVSLIHRTVVFPCEGKGCQCDRAGYELPNCQCNHKSKVSCCNINEADVPEEETCTSNTSEEIGISLHCGKINNVPCQGLEDTLTHSLAKHIVTAFPTVETKFLYTGTLSCQNIFNLQSVEPSPIEKVPIFS